MRFIRLKLTTLLRDDPIRTSNTMVGWACAKSRLSTETNRYNEQYILKKKVNVPIPF